VSLEGSLWGKTESRERQHTQNCIFLFSWHEAGSLEEITGQKMLDSVQRRGSDQLDEAFLQKHRRTRRLVEGEGRQEAWLGINQGSLGALPYQLAQYDRRR
jgi:hypothetical protein